MNENDAGRMEKKIALFHQYLSMGKRIRESLSTGKSEDLVAFLSIRQQLIDQVDALGLAFEKKTEGKSGSFQPLFHGNEADAADSSSRLKSVMKAAEALDRELIHLAESSCAILKDRLLTGRKGRYAAKGYRPAASKTEGSRFLDRTG